MAAPRALIAIGILAAITSYVPDAHAQGLVGTCARVVLKYVGKPLAEAMIQRGSGLVADYFFDKMRGGRDGAVVSQQDIAVLQQQAARQGLSECEMRRQLEQLFAAANAPQDTYSGSTYIPPAYAPPTYAPRPAFLCKTEVGPCQLFQPLPPGNPCYCMTPMGNIPGFAG